MPSKFAVNTDHKFLQLTDDTLGCYNLHDASETAKLVGPLTKELKTNGQWEYYLAQVEPLQYAVLAMQKRGLLVDKGALGSLKRSIGEELAETDERILEADESTELRKPTAKYPNGLGSPKRVGEFLFNQLGLKPLKKTEKGFNSTDQEALFRLLKGLRKKDTHARPILEDLFHRSRLKTLLQRYMDFDIDSDGRVRAQVKMYGTKTMRFAYAKPALQQFPPELWPVFIAKPGHVFLAVDYQQLEAKLLAYLARDEPAIETFESGLYIHAENAKDLFGYSDKHWDSFSPKMVKAHTILSKGFLYGISYGGVTETMKIRLYCPCPLCVDKVPPTLNLKREEMKTAEMRWFQLHPAVRRFQRDLVRHVSRAHCYESPLFPGAKRYISAPYSKDLEREIKNLPMQFGAALLMNDAQRRLHEELSAPIVLQRHDEFVLEIPEGEVDYWAREVRRVMEAPVEGLGGVSFGVDVEVGRSWGSLTPL